MSEQHDASTEALLQGVGLFLGYLALAVLSHYLFALAAPVRISLPAALALAGLLLGGYELWMAIALGAFASALLIGGYSLPLAVVLTIGTVAQALAGAYLLRHFHFSTGFGRLRDASIYIGVAIATALIGPLIGSVAFSLAGIIPPGSFQSTLGNWWTGDALALLTVAPFLMRWLPKPIFHRTRSEFAEIALGLGLIVVFTTFLFWTPYTSILGISLVYFLITLLMWVALRMGPRLMTLALLLLAIIGSTGTIYHSLFANVALAVQLFNVELLISVLVVIFLPLVALAEERKDATHELGRHVERLETALKQLSREASLKNDFIGMLAHELRNPLAPILSSLELLRLTEHDEQTLENVSVMRARVRTMARLLDDLLDVTRLDHHQLELKKELVDLRSILKRSGESARPEIELRRHSLTLELPEDEVDLIVDPIRIEQVIVNLLSNAAKYTDPGGHITLSLGVRGGQVILKVSDDGVGIAPEMLHKIFEPFTQGEPGRRMSRGLGIGLALSKNLIEMHGGSIAAESEGAGQGSTFIVRLPLPKTALQTTPLRPDKRRQVKLLGEERTRFKILVVDDNEAAADMLGQLLRHTGHEIMLAYSGMGALEQYKSFAPEIVVLDIGLPDIEGYEVARMLRARRARATLIALTGYGQEGDKVKARDAGFDYHLVKPVALADLEAVFEQIASEI